MSNTLQISGNLVVDVGNKALGSKYHDFEWLRNHHFRDLREQQPLAVA